MLPDGRWLVSGGWKDYEEGFVGTTQIYSERQGWLDYVPLPGKLEGHCQVTVGDDVFVIGGTSHWVTLSWGLRVWDSRAGLPMFLGTIYDTSCLLS